MTSIELTDTHIVFHPGTYEVGAPLNETIEVEDGKTRRRKKPEGVDSILIDGVEWPLTGDGFDAAEGVTTSDDPVGNNEAPTARGIVVTRELKVGKTKQRMELR